MTQALHEPLEAPAVKETVEELYGRIEARFPEARAAAASAAT